MRLRLHLETSPNAKLPLNYQYEVSSWLYHLFSEENPVFAAGLHDKKLDKYKRSFKYFTFSQIQPERYTFKKDYLLFESPYADFELSFFIPKTFGHFIDAILKDRKFTIKKQDYQTNFNIVQVENLPAPTYKKKMSFRTLSPLCVSKPVDNMGKLFPYYMHPEDDEYEKYLFDNLSKKYMSFYEEEPPPYHFNFVLNDRPKSKLITIKSQSRYPIKVRGYLFQFELTCSSEKILELGYEAGFGSQNSMGFGCVEEVV